MALEQRQADQYGGEIVGDPHGEMLLTPGWIGMQLPKAQPVLNTKSWKSDLMLFYASKALFCQPAIVTAQGWSSPNSGTRRNVVIGGLGGCERGYGELAEPEFKYELKKKNNAWTIDTLTGWSPK